MNSAPLLRRINSFLLAFAIVLLLGSIMQREVSAQEEDLEVLQNWIRWADKENLLHHHWNAVAYELLDQRQAKIRSLSTASEWQARQGEVRRILQDIVGPFPAKTPLNSRVLGTVEKPGFTIEKIVFESRPNFYVTGCLFIPRGRDGKAPAILNVIGHTDIAFRSTFYQQLILNLVDKGFIVLAMDPIGQGERLQYYDPEKRESLVGGSTAEHSHLGKQCLLTGSSAAQYFTWDGIRAIDYLISRPEVDPERIGVTGISGGGTQTSYIAAMDERVAAAAPANYICGFRRLFQSIGPQDAEQNFNRGVLNRVDHADLLEVRAPKPTLVVATTRDFFSIQGAREVVAEAKSAFQALGKPENLSLIEDDLGHGYTVANREGIYSFFQKHLDNPGDPTDREFDYLTLEELTVTETGQVLDSLGGETVFSLNRRRAEGLGQELQVRRTGDLGPHLNRVRTDSVRIASITLPEDSSSEADFHGRWQRPGYAIEKYSISSQGNLVIPLLLFEPERKTRDTFVLYLHPQGKEIQARPGGEIEGLVQAGYTVLAPDLSGSGELGDVNNAVTFLGIQVGASLPGLHASEIFRCLDFLEEISGTDSSRFVAISRGGMASPLLHAAANDSRISRVALIEPLVSYQSVVQNRFYRTPFHFLVPNSLSAYDLPDLEAALVPRPLLMINVSDALETQLAAGEVEAELAIVNRSYAESNEGDKLSILQGVFSHEIKALLESWLAD